MSSVFPLDIVQKEDTPERLQALAGLAEKHKYLATDTNKMVAALKELDLRTPYYLTDNNGLEWLMIKGSNNLDRTAFEEGDKIEAFIDVNKKQWREVRILSGGFTGVASLDDGAICLVTNTKTIVS